MSDVLPEQPGWHDPLECLEATGDLPVDRFLTFQVNQLSTEFERQWTRFMRARAGVSMSEWRILAVLRSGPATFAGIVETTLMNKALMSRSIRDLEEQCLISVGPTPGDARSITLSLTPKGRKLLAEVLPLAMRRQQHLLSVLTSAERRAFYTSIAKLKAAAIAWEEEADPAGTPDKTARGPTRRSK